MNTDRTPEQRRAFDDGYFSVRGRTAGSLGLSTSAHDEPAFPAPDRVGSIAVHPADDPGMSGARRYILTDDADWQSAAPRPWDLLTGNAHSDLGGIAEITASHATVEGWPRQSLTDLARILGHGADVPRGRCPECRATVALRTELHAGPDADPCDGSEQPPEAP